MALPQAVFFRRIAYQSDLNLFTHDAALRHQRCPITYNALSDVERTETIVFGRTTAGAAFFTCDIHGFLLAVASMEGLNLQDRQPIAWLSTSEGPIDLSFDTANRAKDADGVGRFRILAMMPDGSRHIYEYRCTSHPRHQTIMIQQRFDLKLGNWHDGGGMVGELNARVQFGDGPKHAFVYSGEVNQALHSNPNSFLVRFGEDGRPVFVVRGMTAYSGQLEYSFGELSFSGALLNGRPSGQVVIRHPNGLLVSGRHEQGLLIGECQFVNPSGEQFIGLFSHGLPNGPMIYRHDGEFLVADFEGWLPNGLGRKVCYDGAHRKLDSIGAFNVQWEFTGVRFTYTPDNTLSSLQVFFNDTPLHDPVDLSVNLYDYPALDPAKRAQWQSAVRTFSSAYDAFSDD